MHLVLIGAGIGLVATLGYIYVPTEGIGAKSPTLATAIDYGTPILIGAALGGLAALI